MGRTDDDVPEAELTISNLRMMDESSQKAHLFKAIRGCDLQIIRNILQANRSLLNAKMFGYEGSDVFEIIKSKTKRCYTYSGVEKDGYFYPLHVATEGGHKNLTILLIKAGADVTLTDYKGLTAEEKCNGNATHAFYELRGLKFEAKERYQGKTDRTGQRHGQGVLYYKPEGYMEVERQLYRGNFKANLYNGHGTLYFVGTDSICYIGRFKDGMRHGRGIEFDTAGNKIYQGMFREDKREGRGEEYSESVRSYRGEFSNGLRHGFGVAYFPENSKYYGRYENGLMSGLGIYVHPNGDRFEGMFINNKPDGPGSFYERDVYTLQWSAHHALWQAGRKVKELSVAFTPTVADLPDDSNKHMFAEIMNHQAMDQREDVDDSSEAGGAGSGGGETHKVRSIAATAKQKKRLSFCYMDGNETLQTMNKSDWWKVDLGKYLKLPLREAHYMGLKLPEALIAELTHESKASQSSSPDDDAAEEDDPDAEEEEVDEVSGYHFMECTTLFVSYVYITSASKIFEDRLANKGLIAEFPDFEAVYHLVVDAVDTYNELWEDAYRAQQLRGESAREGAASHPSPGIPGGGGLGGLPSPLSPQASSSNLLESRRKMFMSEKEKKEELILKQRAELAIKKGTAVLDEAIEREIGREVLRNLETELQKLLAEESEESVHWNLPVVRKNMNAVMSAGMGGKKTERKKGGGAGEDDGEEGNPPPPPPPLLLSTSSVSGSISSSTTAGGVASTGAGAAGSGGAMSSPQSGTAAAGSSLPNQSPPPPLPAINIEDLFDVNNSEATDLDGFRDSDKKAAHKVSEVEEAKKSNEFAIELLYIMRTSIFFS